ncbi:MAG: 40S ribosomal protein S19 [Candidatus Diapherotrites archaeon]|jgi:small subunit ribosomal protein S19e|uniref:40S ribosomal protein S19 n=1 Tax=Candidatus Iainarchaeum sp. TaxID=3101447 RepID=A0A7K4C014_9ARCH|nr:40S ribosomal protein S19 [Candidatus Diapherotrites archaeon]
MGIYDVPASYTIEEVAEKLKTEIQQPEFVPYVKTGVHAERAPQREDWFYIRMGSILYRAYRNGTIGTEELRSYYGGRKNRGVKREHHYKASGKIIRSAVQALEKAGYLEKASPKGRKITTKGFRLLNESSKLAVKNIEAGKYNKKEKKHDIDSKKRKEVHDALKAQEQKKDQKKEHQKKPQKKEGEQ